MSYQCTVQILGLTRDNPNTKNGGKSTHVARADKIILEMMEERASKSETLDKNLSYKNLYFSKYGTDSGAEITDKITEEFQNMKAPVIGKDGITRYRKPRSDTEFAISAIVHPPAEVTEQWTEEQRAQFFKDAYEILAEIDPIFCDDNLRCYALHRDEAGEHIHTVHIAIRDNGSIGASYTSSTKWLQNLNREFPKKMNERGYDIEEAEQVNYTALHTDTTKISDPEERARAEREKEEAQELINRKRREKRSGGKSVNKYAAEQAEQALKKAEEARKEAEAEAGAIRAEAEAEAGAIRAEAEAEAEKAKRETEKAKRETEKAKRETETARQETAAERQKASQAKQEAETARQETERAKQEAEKARRAILEAQAQESASRELNGQYGADIQAKREQIEALKEQIAALDIELNGNEEEGGQNEGRIKKNKRLIEENQNLEAQRAQLERDITEQQKKFNEITDKIARRTGAGAGRRITETAETVQKAQQAETERERGYQYGG